MNILWVFIVGGLVTFAMRFSFIYLLGRVPLPEVVRRMLRFVPAAVLSAIVVPELLMHSGRFDFSPGNAYLISGSLAVIVAALTKNMLLTILTGMGALLLLQFVL